VRGGFPRGVLEQDKELKKDFLKNYYETIYLKDIIFPNSIRSSSDLYDVLTPPRESPSHGRSGPMVP